MAEIKITLSSDDKLLGVLGLLNRAEQKVSQTTKVKRGGYIYILPNKDHTLFKIGWTIDLAQRLKQLNVMSPYNAEFLHVLETDAPRWAEQQLHNKYDHKRESGEWFKLSGSDLEEIQSVDSLCLPPPKSRVETESPEEIAAALVAAIEGYGRGKLQSLLEEWEIPVTNSTKANKIRDMGREILAELQKHGFIVSSMLL